MITNTSQEQLTAIYNAQKAYFRTGETLPIPFRKQQLRLFRDKLHEHEKALTEALWADLHKSYEEAYLTELGLVYAEINKALKNLKKWSKDECVRSTMSIFPSRSKVIKEPLGTALIIAPWNYPVQLLLNPLVGAMAAGCTAVLKPSPYTPNVAKALEDLIRDTFDEQYIGITQGNRDVNTALLALRWDLIFYTGSPAVGKVVMAAAAKHLTPVVLELGGKSPCIVDKDANIKVAAKRIAWGKALNAGQTCIAPDYLMVHEDIKEPFLQALEQAFTDLLGKDKQAQKHFVRIVSDKAFNRLVGYLKDGKIRFGGKMDAKERFIEPTVLEGVSPDSPLMQEEIFGPLFPVLTFSDTEDAVSFVNNREKPLALYYFGSNSDYVLRHTSSGGACVNDTIMHIVNDNMPFGGVGNSGMSAYHGKDSYEVFTHRRAVVTSPRTLDLPFRYMPYRLFKLIKSML